MGKRGFGEVIGEEGKVGSISGIMGVLGEGAGLSSRQEVGDYSKLGGWEIREGAKLRISDKRCRALQALGQIAGESRYMDRVGGG